MNLKFIGALTLTGLAFLVTRRVHLITVFRNRTTRADNLPTIMKRHVLVKGSHFVFCLLVRGVGVDEGRHPRNEVSHAVGLATATESSLEHVHKGAMVPLEGGKVMEVLLLQIRPARKAEGFRGLPGAAPDEVLHRPPVRSVEFAR